MLTEDKIKRITASFLKGYYKYRPRVGATEVRFDQSSGDIIADGHITFTQEDGKVFIATFEATSMDSASEIIYRLRRKILFWDSFAFASAVSSLVISILWRQNLITVAKQGLLHNLLFFLGIWLIFLAVYGLLFMRSSRYRYIYAISQFKNYFADDQWVVYDEQIFEHSQDPRYLELRHQCTKAGFGIIGVNKNEEPRVIVAAARQDELGNKRRKVAFGNQVPSFSERARVKISKPFDFIKKFIKPISWKENVMRFQGKHRSQTVLGIFAIMLTLSMFATQFLEPKFSFEDEATYEQKLLNQPSEQEPHIVLIDQDAIKVFEEQSFNYLQISSEPIIALDPYKGEADILMHSSPHMFVYYPCERVHNFTGNEFLLQLGLFSNFSNAKKMVLDLTRLGIASNIIWSKCFDNSKNGYILTYRDFFFDEASARKKGVELMKKYKSYYLFKDLKLIDIRK